MSARRTRLTPTERPVAVSRVRHALMRSAIKYILFFMTCGSLCISPFVGNMLDGIFAFGLERASLHDLAAQTRVINVD